MLDRFFAPLLTFVTLIVSTIGFAAALVNRPERGETLVAQGMSPAVVEMERIEIVARRDQLTLPPYDKINRMQAPKDSKPTTARAQRPLAAEGRSVLLRAHWD